MRPDRSGEGSGGADGRPAIDAWAGETPVWSARRKWMGAVLASARAAGCRDVELFTKDGRGRQLTLEPSQPGEPPGRIVSWTRESGAALRVVDSKGAAGFVWAGLGDEVEPAALVGAALLAARAHGPPGTEAATPPPPARGHVPSETSPPDLDLVDPACFQLDDEAVFGRIRDGFAEAACTGEAMIEIDRIVIGEASTTIHVATSAGRCRAFDRTLAMASIALLPASPDARPVLEERAACRMADLDIVECAREAVLRALPERGTVPAELLPAPAVFDLILAPRAAASLIAAIAPAAIAGTLPGIRRPSALTLWDDPALPGAPSSAPFDGAGRPTLRRTLVEGGRSVGRIDAAGSSLQRLSYRDLAVAGPSALVVAPAANVVETAPGGSDAARVGVVELRASIIDIVPGSEWTLRVRRGEIERLGRHIGPADGLVWEGGLDRLLQAFAGTGDDPRWYQCGIAIRTPTLTLRELGPWRREDGRR